MALNRFKKSHYIYIAYFIGFWRKSNKTTTVTKENEIFWLGLRFNGLEPHSRFIKSCVWLAWWSRAFLMEIIYDTKLYSITVVYKGHTNAKMVNQWQSDNESTSMKPSKMISFGNEKIVSAISSKMWSFNLPGLHEGQMISDDHLQFWLNLKMMWKKFWHSYFRPRLASQML